MYSPEFFAAIRRTSRTSAQIIAPIVCDLLTPRSVVDVGCGTGDWLDVFATQGIRDYVGVDGEYAEHAAIPQAHFVAKDLALPCTFERTFDLAISLEVAEHLERERAESFVADLTRLAPAVLFSAAIPGQGGTHHVNEQWQSWWADLFSVHGYAARDVVRPMIWSDDRVAYFYRQNTILYLRDSEPSQTILDLVHPRAFEVTQPAMLTIRQHVSQLPDATRRSLQHRLQKRRTRHH
jgi:SAM-dependent methyltransferase